MIKINLLSEQKAKRTHDRGRELLGIGVLAIVAAGALVFVFVHRPLGEELEALRADTRELASQNEDLERRTQDFDEIEAAVAALEERESSIAALNEAKATPAWLMYELGQILTPRRQPTMDDVAAARARHPNRRWDETWDPKRVWITEFHESDGSFTLRGGARSDTDMTELALRLQASAYFAHVVPEGGDTVSESEGEPLYHQFTITGEVRY